MPKRLPLPSEAARLAPMTPEIFIPPKRTLMGPGPSDVPPSVLEAMSRPLVGHLDPAFVNLMEEIKAMLREVFQTQNKMTFPVSGTGSAGMEFCFVNLIEPGDEVVVGVNGVFGMRMADVAARCGAKVTQVEAEWGRIIEPEQIAAALNGKSPKLVAIVHAETSTGALTPVEEISKIVHEAGALLLLDTVTSLGGCPVRLDDALLVSHRFRSATARWEKLKPANPACKAGISM